MSRRSKDVRPPPPVPVPPTRDLARPAIVFAVAFVLRAVYLVGMRDEDLFRVLVGDAESYDAWARTIAAGDWVGKEVFYQAPLYPYFLGSVYALLGHHLAAVRWAQILLGSLSCVLLERTGSRLLGPAVGLVAGLGLAAYPPAIFFDALIQKSVLDVFFLTALLAVLAPLADQPDRPRRWIAAGAILGLLCLTRENALLLVVLLPFWGSSRPAGRIWPLRLRRGALLVAGLAVVLLPVALRNLAVGGELHLTTSQLGPNLYIGNSPGADGTYASLRPGRGDARYERRDATDLAEQALGRRLKPGEVSRYWRDRALAYMTGQPGEWLRLMGRKALLLVNRVEVSDTEAIEVYAERSSLLRLPYALLHFGLIVPLAAFGIVAAGAKRRRLVLPLLVLLGYAASILVFYVFGRYRYPLAPLLLLLGAAGLVEARALLLGRQWRALLPAAGVLVATLVVANWPLLDPDRNRIATYTNLGRAMAESQQPEAALAYYLRGLALDPANFGLLNNLANQLARTGKYEESLAPYGKALELRPDYAEAHNNLANVLAALGRTREAAEHFQTAIRLNPRYPEAWVNLAGLLAEAGRSDEAIAAYQRAIALDPSFEDAAINLEALLAERARGGSSTR